MNLQKLRMNWEIIDRKFELLENYANLDYCRLNARRVNLYFSKESMSEVESNK